MKLKQKYTRFGFTGFLMMLGLFVSAFILIYIADIIIIELKQKNILKQFENEDYYYINVTESLDEETSIEILENLINTLGKTRCNSSFDSTVNYIENQYEMFITELMININESPEMITQEGKKFLVSSEKSENTLIIGKSILKYSDDNVLIVNDIPVEISCVLNNEYSSGIDYSMFMIWDNCTENMKEKILKNMYERMISGFLKIKLYGNYPTNEDYQLIMESLKEYPVVLEKDEEISAPNEHLDATNRLLNIIFLPVCILFSLYTCFSISFLWLSQRKKEISIRKAFGFSNIQIFRMLVVDILFLSVPSVSIAIISNVVFRFIIGDYAVFNNLSWLKFIIIFIGMILEVVLCAFYLFQRLDKLVLSEEIKS